MPLDDERRLRNDLVHLCLFFIAPHRMKKDDVHLMKMLHHQVPLVVVIAKSDTMTTKETKKYKEQVRVQLEEEGVRTFKFDAKLIEKVERSHAEVPPPSGAPAAEEPYKFQPLYGGSHGQWPWAVMGADGARREYLWGTAETNHPHHSELPALRDLILREGGWQHLKREASLMADAVAEARRHQRARPQWSVRRPSGLALLRAVAVLLAAALVGSGSLRFTFTQRVEACDRCNTTAVAGCVEQI